VLYTAWLQIVQALGYQVAPHIVEWVDLGVPQHRVWQTAKTNPLGSNARYGVAAARITATGRVPTSPSLATSAA